jgi:hypothetical protein
MSLRAYDRQVEVVFCRASRPFESSRKDRTARQEGRRGKNAIAVRARAGPSISARLLQRFAGPRST